MSGTKKSEIFLTRDMKLRFSPSEVKNHLDTTFVSPETKREYKIFETLLHFFPSEFTPKDYLQKLPKKYIKEYIEEEDVIHETVLMTEDDVSEEIIIQTIKFLLKNGAPITIEAIDEAIWFDLRTVVEFLLRKGGREIYLEHHKNPLEFKMLAYDSMKYFIKKGLKKN